MAGAILFERVLRDGSRGILGTARVTRDGWRFYPNICGHKPSRKGHATLEKCLPAWVGYPDGCESRTIEK